MANYVRDRKSAEEFQAEADREGFEIELCRADVSSPKGAAKTPGSPGRTDQTARGLGALCRHRRAQTPDGTDGPSFRLGLRPECSSLSRSRSRVNRAIRPPRRQHRGDLFRGGRCGPCPNMPWWAPPRGALESLVRHMAVDLAPQQDPSECAVLGLGHDGCLESIAGCGKPPRAGPPKISLGSIEYGRRGGPGRPISLFGRGERCGGAHPRGGRRHPDRSLMAIYKNAASPLLTEKPRIPVKEILLFGFLPSFLKVWLYRLRGYRIGHGGVHRAGVGGDWQGCGHRRPIPRSVF